MAVGAVGAVYFPCDNHGVGAWNTPWFVLSLADTFA